MEPATDLDHLVSLGWSAEESQAALNASKGDRIAAIIILRKNGKFDASDVAWRDEKPGDWVSGTHKNLPKHMENRGLWKSPVYARVSSYETEWTGETYYSLSVVLKDGRKWSKRHTYPDFCELKVALPFGTTRTYKNWFPAPSIIPLNGNQIEVRRQQLEDWFRELTLDEAAMSNDKVLQLVYKFIGADANGGPVGVDSMRGTNNTGHGSLSKFARSNLKHGGSSKRFSILEMPIQVSMELPPLPRSIKNARYPMSLLDLHRNLPFRIAVKDLPRLQQGLQQDSNSADVSDKQLQKDYSRDRIIIQGRKFEGSHTDVSVLVAACADVIENLIRSKHCELISRTEAEQFARRVLRALGRTESAYSSFAALVEVLQTGPDQSIIPESTLAEPLFLRFRILEKQENVNRSGMVPITAAASTHSYSNSNTPLSASYNTSSTMRFSVAKAKQHAMTVNQLNMASIKVGKDPAMGTGAASGPGMTMMARSHQGGPLGHAGRGDEEYDLAISNGISHGMAEAPEVDLKRIAQGGHGQHGQQGLGVGSHGGDNSDEQTIISEISIDPSCFDNESAFDSESILSQSMSRDVAPANAYSNATALLHGTPHIQPGLSMPVSEPIHPASYTDPIVMQPSTSPQTTPNTPTAHATAVVGEATQAQQPSAQSADKGATQPWCIVAEGIGFTVYRVSVPETEQTLVQVKVGHRKSLYGMIRKEVTGAEGGDVVGSTSSSQAGGVTLSAVPEPSYGAYPTVAKRQTMVVAKTRDGSGSNIGTMSRMRVTLGSKEGNSHITFEKETQTTQRDWKKG